MRSHKKYTPFLKLSRHKQRDLYVRLRGKIQRTASEYGGNFTSHLLLNEPGRPALYNQWFDFYFLGLDGVTIWNTVLYTANQAYWWAINELASHEAHRLLPKNIHENGIDSWFIPVYDPITGKKLHYVMREPEVYAELENRTHSQFMDDYSSKLIQEDTGNTAPIFESFEIRKDYRYGVGLFAIVDAPEINAETIESMIAKFRSLGEVDWKSPAPVDHSKIHFESVDVFGRKIREG